MVEDNQREVIDDLNKFLSHCEEITDRVCAALSWDKQKLSSETGELVSCQLDPGHRVPRENLASHIEKCRLRQQGLSQDEIDELVPSSMFYYEKATNVYSTVIDKEKLNHILRQQNAGIFTEKEVPPCGRLASVELSPAERLAIHQSVISSAVQAGKPVTEITDDFLLTDFTKKNKKEQDQPKTREETLAVQRDLKRRRQTYRAKNVHITRKSYTEVIREVIESQTEMLSAVAQDEESKDGESARLKSDTRRSRSPKKRSKSQDRDSKSQSRRRSRSRSQSCKRSTSPRNQDSRSARKSKHHKRSRSRSSSRKKKSRDSPSENDSEDSRGHSRSRKHKHKSKHKKHKSNR